MKQQSILELFHQKQQKHPKITFNRIIILKIVNFNETSKISGVSLPSVRSAFYYAIRLQGMQIVTKMR